MQIQSLFRQRLTQAIAQVAPEHQAFADMIRPTQDRSLGDFQINSAMPLAKQLGEKPRDVAQRLVDALVVDDLCESVDIAGPGFINLKLRSDWIAAAAAAMLCDERLAVSLAEPPAKIVIDYSSPNVAKPMHVGHIRSCFIGDALTKILRFLGHQVITDNHLGDWGTQFGMVIYGYRNFLDPQAFQRDPVTELLRIYRIVNRLIDAKEAADAIPECQQAIVRAQEELEQRRSELEAAPADQQKKLRKACSAAEKKVRSAESLLQSAELKVAAVEQDSQLHQAAQQHPEINQAVLEETAKLHAGDAENLQLWHELLPFCMDEINRVYERLDIEFDHVLGESFYHPLLPGVIQRLQEMGLASESEGALCVFLPEFAAPMIVQKKDGAFLYATTDLATIEYRHDEFDPDEILYVVDFRQGEHFKKLFAAARSMGYQDIHFEHVSFGTVLDESGRPLKTRSGVLAGLTALLDDAVDRAHEVVCDPERTQRIDPPLSDAEKQTIAERVGIGAIKYADLAHHRTSDYKFSLDKMVSLDGNTAAYIQYAYARIQGILRSANCDESELVEGEVQMLVQAPAERDLLLAVLRLEEVLHQARKEYAPNLVVDYLYEIAKALAVFYEQCPVLKADDEPTKQSRLAIITLVARVLRQGLNLLGIQTVPRM